MRDVRNREFPFKLRQEICHAGTMSKRSEMMSYHYSIETHCHVSQWPVGTGGTTRIWQLFWEPHKPIHKRGSLTIRQALLYCYKYTCHSCGDRFFYRPTQVARQDCRHFGSSIVEQIWQNETVSCR